LEESLDDFIFGVDNWGDTVKYEVEEIVLAVIAYAFSTVAGGVVD
jgi:hypothetical protein